MIIVYSDITLSKNSYHVETSKSICFASQLTGYYMMQVSKTFLNRMYYSSIINLMTMTYPAPEHETLDFFDYLPDFSKTWNLKQNLKTFDN